MYANPNPSMKRMWHRRANDDGGVRCVAALDGDGRRLVNRGQRYYCADCATVSIVVCLHTNAVAIPGSHVSYQTVVTIYQPNMQANPHDECSADACYVPSQQFLVYDVDSPCSLLIHLYDELHHMILE